MDVVIPKTEDLDLWYEKQLEREDLSSEDKAYLRLLKRWADKGRRSSSQRAMIAQQAEQIKNMANGVMHTLEDEE